MEKKEKKVGEIRGEGTVHRGDGSVIPHVKYHFDVWQEFVLAGDQWLGGLPDYRGCVHLEQSTVLACIMSGERLALNLQDGRWVDFGFSNDRGEVAILSNLRDQR